MAISTLSTHDPALRAKGLGLHTFDKVWEITNVLNNRIVDTSLDIGPPDSGQTHNEGTPEYSYAFDIDTAGSAMIGGKHYDLGASTDNEIASGTTPPIDGTDANIVYALVAYISSSSVAYTGVAGTAKTTAALAWAARPTDEDIANQLGTADFVRIGDMLVIRDGEASASSDTTDDADFDKISCYAQRVSE